MPPRLIEDRELLARLLTLFREVGYVGASLTDIAATTGLQKSSLYNRFPGGKQQMAAEVAAAVGDIFATDLLAPLDTDQPLRQRVEQVAANLNRFYRGGAQNCLLDMLSFGDPGQAAFDNLSIGAQYLIDALATIARKAGADDAEATARAQDAIASIEGALVLARVTGTLEAFERSLQRLPGLLIDPSPSGNRHTMKEEA